MPESGRSSRVHRIAVADNRTVEVHEYGDPDAPAVIAHHGTPGSGVSPTLDFKPAAMHEVRLIMADRAGYGGSDRHPGRDVAAVASDTAAIADFLAIDRFRTWGMSGGGPHALACAALLPDRVIAAASMAGLAPYEADGLAFMAGMNQENIEEFQAASAGERSLRAVLGPARSAMLDVSEGQLVEMFAPILPEVDRAPERGASAPPEDSAMMMLFVSLASRM